MADATASVQRKRILAAAAALFKQQGFPATSVRMIAAAVDLGASSLYNHMSSKQELLEEICFTSAELFSQGLRRIEQRECRFGEKLQAIIGLHVRLALENPETITVFNDEWRHLQPASLEKFLALRRDYENRLKQILHAGIAAGELGDHPLATALPTLLSSFSWIYNLNNPKAADATALKEQLFKIWAQGWIH